jgi:prevent-host-death family protein
VDINYDWAHIIVMTKIAAAKFKEQCLAILDRLEPQGIVITKHGKPVARVLPMARASADLIGSLRGRIRVNADITSTRVKWDAGD